MKTLTAVLFVGGQSRRMGTDKAALVLNGEPLWSRQLRMLSEVGAEKIVISARTRPAWTPASVETVLDQPPSRGPLSGLAAALKKIETTHLVALGVDLPQMTSEHLKTLWKLTRPGTGTVPLNQGTFESLSAIYPVEAGSTAEEMLSGHDVSLRSFINTLATRKRIQYHVLRRSEGDAFQNINTPAEWMRQR